MKLIFWRKNVILESNNLRDFEVDVKPTNYNWFSICENIKYFLYIIIMRNSIEKKNNKLKNIPLEETEIIV